MRIGIDARLLTEQITGIGRYTRELTTHLVEYPAEFHLYSGSPVNQDLWPQANVILHSSSARNRISRMLWSQISLSQWAKNDKVDIFWGTTHRLPSYIPDNMARVVTIHDLVWKHAGDTMRPLSRIKERLLMPRAIRLADRIVADSKSTAHAIFEEYPDVREKVRVVYPGVSALSSVGPFSALDVLGVHHNYCLFVGTLEPRKNLDRLLQAFVSLDSLVRKDYQLVIAGGKGWGKVNLRSLITRYGLGNNVLPLGYVSDEALANLYAHAHFLVMPSLYEGFGLPIVEAMSFGVPVLTSNTSSMPEVAENAGILVDPISVPSIACGLEKIMNPVYRQQLAEKTKSCAARFTWEKAASNLWVIFKEALMNRRICVSA